MSYVCEICGEGVTSWSARYRADVTHCKKCFDTEKADTFIRNKHSEAKDEDSEEENNITPKEPEQTSSLPALFVFFAWFSLIISLIIGGNIFPSGYSPPALAYIPALTWFAIGLVQFAIFLAISRVLIYLKQIVINTSVVKQL